MSHKYANAVKIGNFIGRHAGNARGYVKVSFNEAKLTYIEQKAENNSLIDDIISKRKAQHDEFMKNYSKS